MAENRNRSSKRSLSESVRGAPATSTTMRRTADDMRYNTEYSSGAATFNDGIPWLFQVLLKKKKTTWKVRSINIDVW